MKILTAKDTRALDQCTIRNKGISSWELMERAARVFVHWFAGKFSDEETPVTIYTGSGNNGGDGLAIARLLSQRFYPTTVYCCQINAENTTDFEKNLSLLKEDENTDIYLLSDSEIADHQVPQSGIIIDALFGSGLNRPIESPWSELIDKINQSTSTRVSVDVPSGMFSDTPTGEEVSIHADYSLSFEMPKLAFFMPENAHRLGDWEYQSIGLDEECWQSLESRYHYTTFEEVAKLLLTRQKFDHKGNYGHALLVMGSVGKIGAAVLSARACLRSGAGLVSIHAPAKGYSILQSSVPEAMVQTDEHDSCFTNLNYPIDAYDVIGMGCGIGTNSMTALGVEQLLEKVHKPMVLDADILNILSQHTDWLSKVPPHSILTPHIGEYNRLFGAAKDGFSRLEQLGEQAEKYQVYILLKGAHTVIACPDGQFYFNSSGNPGMATAGSGDVLTGIITSLLAQGYASKEAALLGAYLHGLAGDIAVAELQSQESLIASDIIDTLGAAFATLRNAKNK